MIERKDPAIYQVEQGIDLMASDAKPYNWEENKFSFGFGAYREFSRFDVPTMSLITVTKSIDISALLVKSVFQLEYSSSGIGLKEIGVRACENYDKNLEFIFNEASCINSTRS